MRPTFEGYAKQIGLDVERFKKDVNAEATLQFFDDGKRGDNPKVHQHLLNGREVQFESLPAEKLRALDQHRTLRQMKRKGSTSASKRGTLLYILMAVLWLLRIGRRDHSHDRTRHRTKRTLHKHYRLFMKC